MDLYFVRHGIALDHADIDATRPLTREGIERTRQAADLLKKLEVSWDLLWTSPLVRAMETAFLFQDAGLVRTLKIYSPLLPGGDFTLFHTWLMTAESRPASLALVGHEPDLGHWIEQVLYGESKGCIPLKKSGLARVSWEPDQAELIWLLPPKLY